MFTVKDIVLKYTVFLWSLGLLVNSEKNEEISEPNKSMSAFMKESQQMLSNMHDKIEKCKEALDQLALHSERVDLLRGIDAQEIEEIGAEIEKDRLNSLGMVSLKADDNLIESLLPENLKISTHVKFNSKGGSPLVVPNSMCIPENLKENKFESNLFGKFKSLPTIPAPISSIAVGLHPSTTSVANRTIMRAPPPLPRTPGISRFHMNGNIACFSILNVCTRNISTTESLNSAATTEPIVNYDPNLYSPVLASSDVMSSSTTVPLEVYATTDSPTTVSFTPYPDKASLVGEDLVLIEHNTLRSNDGVIKSSTCTYKDLYSNISEMEVTGKSKSSEAFKCYSQSGEKNENDFFSELPLNVLVNSLIYKDVLKYSHKNPFLKFLLGLKRERDKTTKLPNSSKTTEINATTNTIQGSTTKKLSTTSSTAKLISLNTKSSPSETTKNSLQRSSSNTKTTLHNTSNGTTPISVTCRAQTEPSTIETTCTMPAEPNSIQSNVNQGSSSTSQSFITDKSGDVRLFPISDVTCNTTIICVEPNRSYSPSLNRSTLRTTRSTNKGSTIFPYKQNNSTTVKIMSPTTTTYSTTAYIKSTKKPTTSVTTEVNISSRVTATNNSTILSSYETEALKDNMKTVTINESCDGTETDVSTSTMLTTKKKNFLLRLMYYGSSTQTPNNLQATATLNNEYDHTSPDSQDKKMPFQLFILDPNLFYTHKTTRRTNKGLLSKYLQVAPA